MTIAKKRHAKKLCAAVALAFIATPHVTALADIEWVKCYGINSCMGKSECRLTSNSCTLLNKGKGQNACKGKGFLYETKHECDKLGGTEPEEPDQTN